MSQKASFLTLCFALSASLAWGASCSFPGISSTADGTYIYNNYISLPPTSGGTDSSTFFNIVPGHSYEILALGDKGSQGVVTAIIGDVENACPSADSTALNINDTGSADPYNAIEGGIRRASVIIPSSATAENYVVIRYVNNDTVTHYVNTSVIDTTMFGPRWSTSQQNCSTTGCTGFHTEWGFLNTSNQDVTGRLTLYNSAGTEVATTGLITIKAGTTKFVDTRNVVAAGGVALNVSVQTSGSAVFVHNGSHDSIVADAYIMNPGFSTGPFIQAGKFESRYNRN